MDLTRRWDWDDDAEDEREQPASCPDDCLRSILTGASRLSFPPIPLAGRLLCSYPYSGTPPIITCCLPNAPRRLDITRARCHFREDPLSLLMAICGPPPCERATKRWGSSRSTSASWGDSMTCNLLDQLYDRLCWIDPALPSKPYRGGELFDASLSALADPTVQRRYVAPATTVPRSKIMSSRQRPRHLGHRPHHPPLVVTDRLNILKTTQMHVNTWIIDVHYVHSGSPSWIVPSNHTSFPIKSFDRDEGGHC
jgi:hypothetical protein